MGEMVKRKNGERESGGTGGGNSFLRGVNKKPKIALFPNFPLYLDFSPLGIIIYMSKEYLIFKE